MHYYERLALFDYRCAYCQGAPAPGKRLQTDHIFPVSILPEARCEEWNKVPCCKMCNCRKGARSPFTWSPPNPHPAWLLYWREAEAELCNLGKGDLFVGKTIS